MAEIPAGHNANAMLPVVPFLVFDFGKVGKVFDVFCEVLSRTLNGSVCVRKVKCDIPFSFRTDGIIFKMVK
jgi:hypothetical protein